MLRLEVLISTCRPEGIARVAAMTLPRVGGVGYLVSWQQSEGEPVPRSIAERDDIRVTRNEVTCLSANRNHALSEATGEVLLIADDDLSFTREGLEGVIEAFALRPSMQMALFRFDGAEKSYPDVETSLTRAIPKGFYASSIEIALRRGCLADPRLRFPTDFGLGARYGCGEEEIFLHTARRLGLDVRFIPHTVCRHDGPSTGSASRVADSTLRGYGATIALLYPTTWAPRLLLKAHRGHRSGRMGLLHGLRIMIGAAFSATFKVRRPWRG